MVAVLPSENVGAEVVAVVKPNEGKEVVVADAATVEVAVLVAAVPKEKLKPVLAGVVEAGVPKLKLVPTEVAEVVVVAELPPKLNCGADDDANKIDTYCRSICCNSLKHKPGVPNVNPVEVVAAGVPNDKVAPVVEGVPNDKVPLLAIGVPKLKGALVVVGVL